jgi:transcriptional regulator with XRE-family HTH domain
MFVHWTVEYYPALSRLERGGFARATVEALKKIADALDARLVIKLQEKRS